MISFEDAFSTVDPRSTSKAPSPTPVSISAWKIDTRQLPLVELISRHRPRPARRRQQDHVCRHESPLSFVRAFLSAVFMVAFLCQTSIAARAHSGESQRSALARLARTGEIVLDHRPPPHVDLRRDGSISLSDSSIAVPASSTVAALSSIHGLLTRSSNSPLPSPFDTSLGNNFTSPSCPNFFQTFLGNSTFKSCLPFSLLLQNSNSFFSASKSVVLVTQTLDASCGVDVNSCASLMASLARDIRSDSNCGADYASRNPVVLQAYAGLVAYEPLYHAGCLKNSRGSYCFADAVTNTSSPSDSYVYYLPLGLSLPGGSMPTCDTCLQNTMAIFSNAAANSSQPISGDYVNAAQQIDMSCGPSFVNTTVAVLSGAPSLPFSSTLLATITLLLAFALL